MKETTHFEYQKKINLVVDYISNHLDEKLDLATLSSVSSISPFHFHRITRAYLGEPIGTFTIRRRIETGTHLLRYSNIQVDEIAEKIGYDSPASFSKAFKKHYGVSPSEYRNKNELNSSYFIIDNDILPKGFKAIPEIVERKDKKAMYARLVGDYMTNDYDKGWEKIYSYFKENKLFEFNQEFLGVANNDPLITEASKCMYDCCITINKKVKPDGEIGLRDIPGGKYAVFFFKGSYDYFGAVYKAIFKNWLPNSDVELRNTPSFEKYLKTSKENPDKNRTEIYIPIK
jgi:AraC family transcriptional regulator